MKYKKQAIVILFLVVVIGIAQCRKDPRPDRPGPEPPNADLAREGKKIFRFDTFGDEEFWSGLLHIDKAILGSKNGGFGDGVSPKAALAAGLKVDAEALPAEVVADIQSGDLSLDDPLTTVALIRLNAVLGVKGNFDDKTNQLQSIGLTCAVCHSNVDNSFMDGVGKRLDGWPNRDLNVGGIISLTDNPQPIADMLHVDVPTLSTVLGLWGPGKFPAILFMDGKAFRDDGKIAANLIPPAFGLNGIGPTTYTAWGDISYWNAFVANLEMHGKGNFVDPRLNNPAKYPIAVENGFYNVMNTPDLITSKLPALRAYQHSIDAPEAPASSYNKSMADKGRGIFFKSKCGSCHVPPLYTDANFRLHRGMEIGIDDFEAKRSPTGKYRTTPLRGMIAKTEGGFYHDGRFATLLDVVNHYNNHFELNLSNDEKLQLAEFLKSL